MLRMMGPPPRTRGTRSHPGRDAQRTGTTPAYAGNAVGRASRWSWGRDHPRVRGERGRGTRQLFVPWGPPPRTRGTRQVRDHELAAHGTTAPRSWPRSDAGRDHPRVRGERAGYLAGRGLGAGPPPRTRGTHPRSEPGQVPDGTTPAYAGNASGASSRRWFRWDHPRVRGERARISAQCPSASGPPPRTRGTHGRAERVGQAAGTTPAYAGNAGTRMSALDTPRDHPRVRGERLSLTTEDEDTLGPPPRTRGTRHRGDRGGCEQGTTPAYAGNASSATSAA